MALSISRSTPFRWLQSRIGSSTYQLNTLLVGLQLVSEGGGDGGAIAVTWPKPKSLDQAKQTANRAKAFACRSALVLAGDIADSFVRRFACEEWLGFSSATREVATKAKTRPKSQGGDYSIAERATCICEELDIRDEVKIAALDLLTRWRNTVVHSGDRSRRLQAGHESILIDAALHFYEDYSHFDIELALKNFRAGSMPVPKEATSLIAAFVNLARALDKAAIRRAADTPDKICVAADSMLRSYFRARDDRPTSPWRELSDAWQGEAKRRRGMLMKFWATSGLTENKSPISAELPAYFIEEIVDLGREAFATRFGIGPS